MKIHDRKDSNESTNPHPPLNLVSSFGYHPSNLDADKIRKTSNRMESIKKIAMKVALVGAGCLFVGGALALAAAVVAMTPVTMGIFAGVTAISGTGLLGGLVTYCVITVCQHRHICKTAGIIYGKEHDIQSINPREGKCESLPTEHPADTEQWRLKLVKAAQHNIVISGNYCGGKSFRLLLDEISKRMDEVPELKVIIISSPRFITENSEKKLKVLQEKFSERFSLIESPDTWHISPGLKKTTNHTKCTVIDYGKYYILGGSGIQDNFAKTGLDTLSKEEYFKMNNIEKEVETSEEDSDEKDKSLIERCVPTDFRDMDFVFRNSDKKGESGIDVYRQMLLLAFRWERYGKCLKNGKITPPDYTLDQLGAFSENKNFSVNPDDSLITRLMKTPIPDWETLETQVHDFDDHEKKSNDVKVSLIASGPEQSKSLFEEKLVERFYAAEEKIVINHMYFHPTHNIICALISAANRGVKIEIITCGVFPDSPVSHRVFVPRNKYNIAELYRLVEEKNRHNIEVFEFKQQNKGSHKKAIVVDDFVIAGSSNLGYKSLVSTSDHELNFIAKSKEFADKTLEIFEIDKNHSVKVECPGKVNFKNKLCAGLHRILAPLIG